MRADTSKGAILMGAATKIDWANVFDDADAAGRAAAEACVPVPMVATEHADPLDDSSPVVRRYAPILDGVCGFAWITIYPGNCAAANFAKKNWAARPGYEGGMQVWVSSYGQSMETKEAYAQAFADVLKQAGVKAYSGSRGD
jgi:hypothetical protein